MTEIKRRIALAKKSFMNKKSIITNKVMLIESKKRFIKCFVWSVLLYGCETWAISKTNEKILMAMEMRCWKRMLRISCTKKITSEKVLELASNKRSLMETIRKRQLSFVGHIIRENGLERLCLEQCFSKWSVPPPWGTLKKCKGAVGSSALHGGVERTEGGIEHILFLSCSVTILLI